MQKITYSTASAAKPEIDLLLGRQYLSDNLQKRRVSKMY